MMGLPEADTGVRPRSDDGEERSAAGRLAARCWALLLARIYECLPLLCSRCGEPMRIIALILDPPVIERILTHIGEPVTPPAVLAAILPASELERDDRGGKMSPNQVRSGASGGGTMRLKFLSPGA